MLFTFALPFDYSTNGIFAMSLLPDDTDIGAGIGGGGGSDLLLTFFTRVTE